MNVNQSKVFLITGGARGIGRSIYKSCIESGNLAIICSRNIDEVNKTIAEIDPAGEKSLGLAADVSKYDDVKKMIEEPLLKFGKIDVLVNNAGIYGPIGQLETNDNEAWKQAIKINLLGTVNCCQLVLPIMKKMKSGKIINLAGAGVGGTRPLARFSAYYTSKMAIVGFTEVLAAEVKDDNIQVNCISPGGVNTYFTDLLIQSGIEKAGKEMFEQALKQKETGGDSPELAAKMVMFLASSKSDHISGKIISAKWEKIDILTDKKNIKNNLYNLRRIDDNFFYEK